MAVPCVVVCGRSGSGKTRLVEGVLRELRARGLSAGAVKHTSRSVEFDRPGKDSWRFAEAGASTVALVTPSGYALYRRGAAEAVLDRVLRHFEGVDVVIVEGFKAAPFPKIEVTEGSGPDDLVCRDDPYLLAVAVARPEEWHFHPGVRSCPVFDRNDHRGIADFVISRMLEDRNPDRRT